MSIGEGPALRPLLWVVPTAIAGVGSCYAGQGAPRPVDLAGRRGTILPAVRLPRRARAQQLTGTQKAARHHAALPSA